MIKQLSFTLFISSSFAYCFWGISSCIPKLPSLVSISINPSLTLSRTPTAQDPLLVRTELSEEVTLLLSQLNVTSTESDIKKLATPGTQATIAHEIKIRQALSQSLHTAIDKGNIAAVENILKNPKTSIDARSASETPLTRALGKKRFDIALLLLVKGANPHLPEELTGNTPLHIAAREGNVLLVTTLIEKHSVDINAKNKKKESALLVAKRGETSKFLYMHPALDKDEKEKYYLKYPSRKMQLLGAFVDLLGLITA